MYKLKNFLIKLAWTFFQKRGTRHSFGEDNYNPIIIEEIVKALNLSKKDYILEAGCGDGFVVDYLCNLGIKAIGVDCTAVTRGKGEDRGYFLQADITSLPFGSNIFDKIICYGVLHYVGPANRWGRALSELHRTLKPGGVIFIGEIIQKKGYFNDYLKAANVSFLKKIILYVYLNSPLYPYYFYSLEKWEKIFKQLNLQYKFLAQNKKMPYHRNMKHCVLIKR